MNKNVITSGEQDELLYIAYFGKPLPSDFIKSTSTLCRFLIIEKIQDAFQANNLANVDACIINLSDMQPDEEQTFFEQKKLTMSLMHVPCMAVCQEETNFSNFMNQFDDFYVGSLDSPLFVKRLQNFLRFNARLDFNDHHDANPIELAYMAYYDSLTGLPNRQLFDLRLNKVFKLIQFNSELFALAYLDLDGFKEINDKFGHEVGDWLLVQVAARIKSNLRKHDMVARYGGDEFAILLMGVNEPKHLATICTRILDHLQMPYVYNSQVLRISASIGCVRYPDTARNLEVLKKMADQAMYSAKLEGKSRCVIS